jgi:hypothetical protein
LPKAKHRGTTVQNLIERDDTVLAVAVKSGATSNKGRGGNLIAE